MEPKPTPTPQPAPAQASQPALNAEQDQMHQLHAELEFLRLMMVLQRRKP
jgi:hypothetical protein